MRTHVLVAVLAMACLVVPVFAAAPTNGTVTPSSGTYTPDTWYTFTTTHDDADGYADIQNCRLLINSVIAGPNSVYAYYSPVTDLLSMRNDAGVDPWLGGVAPGTVGIIENSQGRLDTGATTVIKSGTTVTVNWKISFKDKYQGLYYNTYIWTEDATISANWADLGDAKVFLDDPNNLLKLQGATSGSGNYTFALGTGNTITDWANTGQTPSYSINNGYPGGGTGADGDGKWVGASESSSGNNTRTPELRRTVTVVPQTPYLISVWVSTDGSPHPCSAFLQWKNGTVTGNGLCTTVASFTTNTSGWQRLSAIVLPSGTVMTISLKLSWNANENTGGGGGNFDMASVTVDTTQCPSAIATTITGCTANATGLAYITTPPDAGTQRLTVTGTNLDKIQDGIELVSWEGAVTIPSTIVAGTKFPGSFQADVNFAGVPVSKYNVVTHRTQPSGCPDLTAEGIFEIKCSQPATTAVTYVVGTNWGLKGNSAHKLVLQGTGLASLLPANGGNVFLRRTYTTRPLGSKNTEIFTDVTLQPSALAMNGSDLEVTFNLSGTNALGGRYDIVYSHTCPSLSPTASGRGFLIYLSSLTNGGFEDGWNNDLGESTGSICQLPTDYGNNGLRPTPKHWDRGGPGGIIDWSGGFWRDGTSYIPDCVAGLPTGATGLHYTGIQNNTHNEHATSIYQTIQAPYVSSGTSGKAYNLWADFCLYNDDTHLSQPPGAKIRVYDGTIESGTPLKDALGNNIEKVILSNRELLAGDVIISNPDYKVTIPSGTVYTSNPPLLTIEILFTTQKTGDYDDSNVIYGLYVDNVRSDAQACGVRVVWADRNGDGFVDMEDFALLQTCFTIGGGTPVDTCGCFDKAEPFNSIENNDLVEFIKCATGPNVPWTLLGAPTCAP